MHLSPHTTNTIQRTSLFVLLICFCHQLTAQKRPTYYDSIIYRKMYGNNPSAVDTNLRNADDAIDAFYEKSKAAPACMWYGNNFSSHRVKERYISMDSLPDEINIRLIKKDGEFCFPVKGRINSPYGWRWERAHRGVDINLNTGAPVHAAFSGVVRLACSMGGYGNVIVVRHYNGLETVYGHLSKIKVKPRQIVNAGDVIGLGGSTGRSTGPHLHFEVRFQYETFDPEWILDFKKYQLRTKHLKLNKTYFGVTRPRGKGDVEYKADASYINERPERKEVYYNVQGSDSWEDIAIRYSTTVDRIKKLNPEGTKLTAGAQIRVR